MFAFSNIELEESLYGAFVKGIDEEIILKSITSITATKQAAIIAKTSPPSKVGPPHRNGYGNLILHTVK